ncbi:hypothetical protein AHAS_Ahas11G0232400 [Arachis hypogaea]
MVLQDEQGDRIHATICKHGLDLFRERIKEHAVYSMPNFILKINNGKVRTTAHNYKLSFYRKIDVEVLPIETFAFNPFKMCPFAELEANAPMDENLLFDYIGEVVRKEEAMHMLDIKCPKILLELYYAFHSKKHNIKCTLFAELVDQVLPHFERDDGEPFIMVVQLFKSNVYLSSVNVQSTYYVPKSYFNPNLPKPQYSVADEINAGIAPIRTIEDVLNMIQETSYWIVGNIVSLEIGKDDWSYTSCKTCPKKVLESKDMYWCDHCRRVGFKAILSVVAYGHVFIISGDVLLRCCSMYKLQVIVTDESGCMKLLLWNKEVEQMVEKAAEKIKELCDSTVEINGDSSYETPAKRSSPDTGDGSTVEAGVSADVQASTNETFKRNCGKKITGFKTFDGLHLSADIMVVKTFKPYNVMKGGPNVTSNPLLLTAILEKAKELDVPKDIVKHLSIISKELQRRDRRLILRSCRCVAALSPDLLPCLHASSSTLSIPQICWMFNSLGM